MRVTANDGNRGRVTDTFTYSVANIAPTPTDDEFIINEDTPLNGDVSVNDSDPDGDTTSFSATTQPSNGTLIWGR